ncbi:MAG: hypothetical protein PF447_03410 [Spirochaetaceae bacterium]|nr:hypothetical protein [Spirochaetaceae bacterium]
MRYPENRQKAIAAEYERAFIYYKWEDYNKAEELFNIILNRYEEDPYAYLYPSADKILTEDVLETIKIKKEIAALPFFKRGAALRDWMGTGRDETAEYEPQAPSQN